MELANHKLILKLGERLISKFSEFVRAAARVRTSSFARPSNPRRAAGSQVYRPPPLDTADAYVSAAGNHAAGSTAAQTGPPDPAICSTVSGASGSLALKQPLTDNAARAEA